MLNCVQAYLDLIRVSSSHYQPDSYPNNIDIETEIINTHKIWYLLPLSFTFNFRSQEEKLSENLQKVSTLPDLNIKIEKLGIMLNTKGSLQN